MNRASFVFTIFFMLLGPVKVIPAFLRVTSGRAQPVKREVAIRATVIASIVVAGVALLGSRMMANYQISLDSLRIAGGLVLLISALRVVFPSADSANSELPTATPLQLAISPVALPIIVPPAGIAAIMIFVMLAPNYPGLKWIIAAALTTMMILDFLVMFFIDRIVKVPGLVLVLQVAAGVLVFIQVALAIEIFLTAFRNLGVVR
jgi:multiple antibiotic resistance protein